MKRILLILDGTDRLDEAMAEVKHLCDPNDKLTILSVAETPSPEVLGMRPSHITPEPYTGPGGAPTAPSGLDVPIMESEGDVERRIAGELRDALDERVGALQNGIRIWTQAIVRDRPATAVADYVRASDFEEVAVPRRSLDRLHELLTDPSGQDALDGSLAPVIVLPA
jgi:nucleotide-binding universal stress UspA family protein